MRRSACCVCLLLIGCGGSEQSDKVIIDQVETNGGVAKNLFDDESLVVALPTGEKLSVTCGEYRASVDIDTKRPAQSQPPLHGIFGTFTIDGVKLAPSELGWIGLIKSAWSLHDRNPTRPTAAAIAAANEVTFRPPAEFGGDSPITWRIQLKPADRARIVSACR